MGAPQNFVSVSRRQLDVEDYIDMMRRHRSWIIGPTWAGLVISVAIALFWPSTYESYANLRITPQLISERMVPDVVSEQISQRMRSVENDVLSRGSLSPIIVNKKLYPSIVKNYSLEDAVEQMIKDIKVSSDFQGGGDRGFATSVQVRFAYPDRFKARDVVNALAGAFIDANMAFQNNSARSTASFMTEQVKEAKAKLDSLNESLLKFREENQGKLPEQAAVNGQQLSILQSQITQDNDRLNNIELSKNTLATQLQGRTDILNLLAQTPGDSGSSQAVTNQKLINADIMIRQQEMKLAALREQYHDGWPAVQQAEAELKVLKDEEAKQQALRAEEMAATNPQAQAQAQAQRRAVDVQRALQLDAIKQEIAAFRTQIDNANKQIENITKEKADLNRRMGEVNAKIDASPAIEQQFSALSRDVGLAQENYDASRRKEEMSLTAKDLQDTSSAARMELQDPANLPTTPSKPNRWAIAGGGSVVGLMLGFVLAAAKEAKDAALKNLKDVRAYANLPVLSSIPLLENALLVRRKRRLLWLGWSTAVMAGLGAMGASTWYYYLGGGK